MRPKSKLLRFLQVSIVFAICSYNNLYAENAQSANEQVNFMAEQKNVLPAILPPETIVQTQPLKEAASELFYSPEQQEYVQTVSSSELSDSERLYEVAKGLLGIHYQYGGKSPQSGFDCSGFVSYVYKHALSKELPTSSRAMHSLGEPVSLKSLKPGDLLFFKINTSHVGIYLGNNRFIHAPSKNRNVSIDVISGFFQSKLTSARRVLFN